MATKTTKNKSKIETKNKLKTKNESQAKHSKLSIKIKKPVLDPKKNLKESVSGFKVLYYLTKKEINNYFSSALVYIVLSLFVLAVCGILFGVFRYLEFGTTDLTQLFTSICFAFVFIIPALTMGTISKEKEDTTIEYMLTKPVTELQFLLSKLFSVSFVIIIMLALTTPIALFVGRTAIVDNGQITMQYFGAFILGLCFASVGIASSSFFKNEISSFLTSLVISGLFTLVGSQIIRILPFEFDAILSKVGIYSHFVSLSRGVLDVRDVFYFAAFISVFLVIANYSLAKIKYPANSKVLRISQIVLVISVVLAITIGALGQFIPGRIDFTSNKKYTLSDSSKKIIGQIEEDMNITLFTSTNLPAQFQEELRSVEDILRDYNIQSKGKIKVEKKYTDKDSAAATEASQIGLQELVFAVNTEDSSQRAVGYFGLAIAYQESKEPLQLVGSSGSITNDIEFQLTKKIQKLTKSEKKVIAFVPNNMIKGRMSDFSILSTELQELYEINDLTLDENQTEIPEEVDVLVLPGPNAKFPDTVLNNIKEFYESGKSIFLMTETIDVPFETLVPTINEFSMGDFFSDYGVNVDQNFVYDLSSSNQINGGSDLIVIPVDYPLWIKSITTQENSPILKQVNNVSLLWASSITIENQAEKERTLTRLLETSSDSNIQSVDEVNLEPGQKWTYKDTDSIKTIAVSIENEKGGRAVLAADALFLTDQYINQNDNFTFALSTLEWLSNEDSVSEIKAKTRVAERIDLDQKEKNTIVIVAIGIPVATVLILGVSKYYQKRREQGRVYEVTAGK